MWRGWPGLARIARTLAGKLLPVARQFLAAIG
jgi:hypothetical protein